MISIPYCLALIKATGPYLSHNAELFDIYQGNLLPYVEQDLAAQLSKQSYEQAKFRIAPINVLRRIIDKLSKIYQPAPVRSVIDGTDADSELLQWYAESWQVDMAMNQANEHFNLFKTALLQPYLWHGKPRLRVIPSDRFIPYSTDDIDDTEPTGFVINRGTYFNDDGKKRKLYFAIDAARFVYFDEDGKDVTARFAPVDNPEGVNVYGRIPYVYVNRSMNDLLPVQDTDTLRMTKLIPILLADTNYAAMFQAFSVFYGINISDENMKWGPNTFLQFKTEPGVEGAPSIGTLTPNLNVDGSLNLIASQLAFWLNSRGIRPGAVGDITASNFQSGISKIVDEMDTSEDRCGQIDYFERAEADLWNLQLNYIHPVWVREGQVENRAQFSAGAYVETKFLDQTPFLRRGELIAEVRSEIEAGLTTREIAVKRLNPAMTDEQVEELLVAIDEQNGVTVGAAESQA
jgi:hypothetical protein